MTMIDPAAITALQNRGGKGHAPRKGADYEYYASNYDLIFGKKTKIISTDEAWEDGTLGCSSENAKVASDELQVHVVQSTEQEDEIPQILSP